MMFILIVICLCQCKSVRHGEKEVNVIRKEFLDSVKKNSDTTYTKPYRNNEFVFADYYINRKDSTLCQVMRDSASHVRQVIITRKSSRVFTAEYYSNGQLKALLPLDSDGKFDGLSKSYYENGCLKSKGAYYHGFYSGRWEQYNIDGDITRVEEYDRNGQLIRLDNKE